MQLLGSVYLTGCGLAVVHRLSLARALLSVGLVVVLMVVLLIVFLSGLSEVTVQPG